jgi:hypothetical protein
MVSSATNFVSDDVEKIFAVTNFDSEDIRGFTEKRVHRRRWDIAWSPPLSNSQPIESKAPRREDGLYIVEGQRSIPDVSSQLQRLKQ